MIIFQYYNRVNTSFWYMQPSYPIRSQCFPCIPLKMFRGYKKGTFGRNGLNWDFNYLLLIKKKIHNKTSLRHAIVHEKIPEDSKKKKLLPCKNKGHALL